MAHLTVSVEYGIHCLLWLAGPDRAPVSSRDLAELQGISTSFVAKIFPKLEKAGIVRSSEGGLRKARNLCLAALLEAVRDRTKTVELKQVNRVLLQPHWRKEVDLPH